MKPTARAFYEIEAARECWSVRQLERQIGSQLFERLANHRDPEEVLALARRGQEVAKPTDVIKDPFVLEFLDLGEPAALHERDVEQAIIRRMSAWRSSSSTSTASAASCTCTTEPADAAATRRALRLRIGGGCEVARA